MGYIEKIVLYNDRTLRAPIVRVIKCIRVHKLHGWCDRRGLMVGVSCQVFVQRLSGSASLPFFLQSFPPISLARGI